MLAAKSPFCKAHRPQAGAVAGRRLQALLVGLVSRHDALDDRVPDDVPLVEVDEAYVGGSEMGAMVGRAASDEHRSMALAIATAAGSAGQVVGPPLAEGLFHRAIAQSPSDSGRWLHLRRPALDFLPAEEAGSEFATLAVGPAAVEEWEAAA